MHLVMARLRLDDGLDIKWGFRFFACQGVSGMNVVPEVLTICTVL